MNSLEFPNSSRIPKTVPEFPETVLEFPKETFLEFPKLLKIPRNVKDSQDSRTVKDSKIPNSS